jgi:hypothetical protein
MPKFKTFPSSITQGKQTPLETQLAQKMLTPSEKARVFEIAEAAGVQIPGSMSIVVWPAPILEALITRLISLEDEVQMLRKHGVH